MNRTATFSAALVLAAATASSVLAGPSVTLNPNIARQIDLQPTLPQVRINTPARTTVGPLCPDLSLETSQHEQADGSIRVTIKVVNHSGVDYLATGQQQSLVVQGRDGGRSSTLPFGSVPRGGDVIWGDVFRPFEFPATYVAHIVYDPDITLDGNPQNDDCRSSNNTASITTMR